MYRGSRLLCSLRNRETYNINQMIILYKPSFPLSEASYRKTGLAKTAKNWLYYLIDTILCDPIKQRLLWLFFLICLPWRRLPLRRWGRRWRRWTWGWRSSRWRCERRTRDPRVQSRPDPIENLCFKLNVITLTKWFYLLYFHLKTYFAWPLHSG